LKRSAPFIVFDRVHRRAVTDEQRRLTLSEHTLVRFGRTSWTGASSTMRRDGRADTERRGEERAPPESRLWSIVPRGHAAQRSAEAGQARPLGARLPVLTLVR
jgi:hypothetical protein